MEGYSSQQRSNCIPTPQRQRGVWGKMLVQVSYKGQTKRLALLVVKGGSNLVGRKWLKAIKLDWKVIFRLQIGQQQELETLL